MKIRNQNSLIILFFSSIAVSLSSIVSTTDNALLNGSDLQKAHERGCLQVMKLNNVFLFNPGASFDPGAVSKLFGGFKLPAMVPEKEVNARFKDPIVSSYKLLENKVISLKISDVLGGMPCLESVTESFAQNQCLVCLECLEDVLSNRESCYKTKDNKYLHRDCVVRCAGGSSFDDVVEVRPLLQGQEDLYAVLSLQHFAAAEEIEAAYQVAAQDSGKDDARLVEAYTILSDENYKRQYDQLFLGRMLSGSQSEVLIISLTDVEAEAIEKDFWTLVSSIAWLYGFKDGFFGRRLVGDMIDGFEARAYENGFRHFFDNVIMPTKNKSGDERNKAIMALAQSLTLHDKLVFLSAWMSGTMISNSGSKEQKEEVLLSIRTN